MKISLLSTIELFVINVLISNSVCVQIHRSTCRKETLFKIAGRNSKLSGGLISSIVVKALSSCVKSCLNTDACQSVNYLDDFNNPTCELLNTTLSGGGSLVSINGWRFYQPVNTTVSFFKLVCKYL